MSQPEQNKNRHTEAIAAHGGEHGKANVAMAAQMVFWFRQEGPWWAASFVFHLVLMMCIVVGGTYFSKPIEPSDLADAPSFEEADVNQALDPPKVERFEVGENSMDPAELSTESLKLNQAAPQVEMASNDAPSSASASLEDMGGGAASTGGPTLGGLGGFDVTGIGSGSAVHGSGGVGSGSGTGNVAGLGSGNIAGLSGRGDKMKKEMVGGFGGTKPSERAVGAALNWIARHQNHAGARKGSWSISKYSDNCKDPTCTGPGEAQADAGATALGVLPFLAAGQTHDTKGSPYRATVQAALYWLISQQTKDGDLAPDSTPKMYNHGLATIALCEACGLVPRDRELRRRAQLAIDFIEKAQNPSTGGWRYNPGEEGDVSVVGWQVMALKSGQMAGLRVDHAAIEGAQKFLKSCSKGQLGGQYAYMPTSEPTPPMTAVAILCCQYMGIHRDEPNMKEGIGYLMGNLPDPNGRNFYYWYYATQVMHNVPGSEWDTWNRKMRRTLIETQCKQGCATGSWDPEKPVADAWGKQGGRLMVTSLGALTLEVYYRYLPLYKLEPSQAKPQKAAKSNKDDKPTKGDKAAAESAKKPETKDAKPATPAAATPAEKSAGAKTPAEKPASKDATPEKPAEAKPDAKPAAESPKAAADKPAEKKPADAAKGK
jgi:hypothetical protein